MDCRRPAARVVIVSPCLSDNRAETATLAICRDGHRGHTNQLDMEFGEIHIDGAPQRIDDVVPHEDEKERASNCYVMSLVAVMIGLPMPIINLAATGIFYLMSRRGTFFVRWNAIQALVSQVPLFIMNNILFWWTVRILFCFTDLSSAYIAYFLTVNLYNVYDFVETVRSAMRTRKGQIHRWYLYSTITDKICRQ